MKEYKTMTVTELDRLYWESFGKMRNARSRKDFNDADAVCRFAIKELENRGLKTPSQIAEKIKEERGA